MKPKRLTPVKLTHPRWRPVVKLLQEGLSETDIMFALHMRQSDVRRVIEQVTKEAK